MKNQVYIIIFLLIALFTGNCSVPETKNSKKLLKITALYNFAPKIKLIDYVTIYDTLDRIIYHEKRHQLDSKNYLLRTENYVYRDHSEEIIFCYFEADNTKKCDTVHKMNIKVDSILFVIYKNASGDVKKFSVLAKVKNRYDKVSLINIKYDSYFEQMIYEQNGEKLYKVEGDEMIKQEFSNPLQLEKSVNLLNSSCIDSIYYHRNKKGKKDKLYKIITTCKNGNKVIQVEQCDACLTSEFSNDKYDSIKTEYENGFKKKTTHFLKNGRVINKKIVYDDKNRIIADSIGHKDQNYQWNYSYLYEYIDYLNK
ncbi:MAG: hypothetical protein EAZ97_06645 [Bacteroidetes bacterium]|nr:MAG: hypothetical protein EAZ97_06645 [Bacteroidota bacterium]